MKSWNGCRSNLNKHQTNSSLYFKTGVESSQVSFVGKPLRQVKLLKAEDHEKEVRRVLVVGIQQYISNNKMIYSK